MATCPQCFNVRRDTLSTCEHCGYSFDTQGRAHQAPPLDPYDQVAAELQRQFLIPGLWTRAYAEAGGDDARARAIYIKYRVAQLCPPPPPPPPPQPLTSDDFGTAWVWFWVFAFAAFAISTMPGIALSIWSDRWGVSFLYLILGSICFLIARAIFSHGMVRIRARRMTGTYYGVEVAYMAALFFAFDYFAEEGSRHSDPPATKLAVFLVLAVTYPIVFAIRRRCLSRPPGSAFSRSFDFLASALTGLFAGVIAVILISTGSNTDEHTDEHFSPTTNRVIFAVVGLITTAVSFTRKIE